MGNVSPITTLRKKIWVTSLDNTNVVEAAHALSNHCGKNLKLLVTVITQKRIKKTIVIDTNVEGDCFEDDNYEEDNHNKESELALRFKELKYWEND
ncbi:unnamed protein product [Rhizophagus irregularis]|uniref:Uncharacterized protein n=1 Tax=Rhizophagus irregularis TaxID=588596 RepID=A0A2N1NE80_9GLOM|nr:hypothetical protein RhiirC2_848572 [Rhizophagus irregularis]CAB4399917.1 unnamed protein product [Rhizophagus irregularis]